MEVEDESLEVGEIRDEDNGEEKCEQEEVIILKNSANKPNINDSSELVNINSLQNDKQESRRDSDVIITDHADKEPSDKLPSNYIYVNFSNDIMSNLYKRQFLKFIQTFEDLTVTNDVENKITIKPKIDVDDEDIVIMDTVYCLSDDSETSKLPKKQNATKKKKKKKQAKNQFIVDRTPEFMKPDDNFITRYIPKFSLSEKDETNTSINPSILCFNCDGAHALQDCHKKRDPYKIRINKEKFLNKNKVQRYHLKRENKYHQLKPGKISSKLRKALGISDHQIPSYIYKMRKEGYPPGWLEEAKVLESDLCMFDSDGNHLNNSNKKDIRNLDTDKLIRYPGFNVPLSKEFVDEHRKYSVGPYSELFSIEKMIEYYNQLKQKDNLETQDMDLDSSSDVICFSDLEIISQVKLNEKIEDIDLDNNTLNDLNFKKNLLLQELQKSNENLAWSFDTNENTPPAENDDTEANKTVSEITDLQVETISEKENLIECNSPSTPTRNKSDYSIKMTMFGTPILKSASPYMDLPNPDNFSKGISPVVNFDNLPNSIGKYEQLFGVLQKVRAQKHTQSK